MDHGLGDLRLGDKVQIVHPRSVLRDYIGEIKQIDPSRRCLEIEILLFDRPTTLEFDFDSATDLLKKIEE